MSTAALAAGATTQVTAVPEVAGYAGRRNAAASPGRRPSASRSGPAPVTTSVATCAWSTPPRPAGRRSSLPRSALTRRGRMLLTTVSVLVFGAAIAVLGLRVAGVLDPAPQFTHTISVQVGAGQSLWSIAQETNPAWTLPRRRTDRRPQQPPHPRRHHPRPNPPDPRPLTCWSRPASCPGGHGRAWTADLICSSCSAKSRRRPPARSRRTCWQRGLPRASEHRRSDQHCVRVDLPRAIRRETPAVAHLRRRGPGRAHGAAKSAAAPRVDATSITPRSHPEPRPHAVRRSHA